MNGTFHIPLFETRKKSKKKNVKKIQKKKQNP